MTKRRTYSSQEKQSIYDAHNRGVKVNCITLYGFIWIFLFYKVKLIADSHNISIHSIHTILKTIKAHEGEVVDKRKYNTRPKKVTTDDENFICDLVAYNSAITLIKLQESLKNIKNKDISQTTIHEILTKKNITLKLAGVCPENRNLPRSVQLR